MRASYFTSITVALISMPSVCFGQAGDAVNSLSLQNSLWETNTISVCWENAETVSPNKRNWVQSAVADTWERYGQLKFVGWGNCARRTKGIRILAADQHPHVKALGRHLNGVKNGMVLNFQFIKQGKSFRGCSARLEFCVKSIAVHEFGHALGLAHEQDHKDSECELGRGQAKYADYNVTAYDLHSIMNYCNPKWNGDGRLSQLDIEAIRILYANRNYQRRVAEAVFGVDSLGRIYYRNSHRRENAGWNYLSKLYSASKVASDRNHLVVLQKQTNEIWKLNTKTRNWAKISCVLSGVVDIAATNGMVFAIERSKRTKFRVFYRSLSKIDQTSPCKANWALAGEVGNDVTHFAGVNGFLFVVNRNRQLFRRIHATDNTGKWVNDDDWRIFGEASNVRSLAGGRGFLWASDDKNRLWRRVYNETDKTRDGKFIGERWEIMGGGPNIQFIGLADVPVR